MLLLTLISIALVFLLLKAAIYLFVVVWNKVEKKR